MESLSVLLILYTEELNKKVMQEFLESLSAGRSQGMKKAGPAGPALFYILELVLWLALNKYTINKFVIGNFGVGRKRNNESPFRRRQTVPRSIHFYILKEFF